MTESTNVVVIGGGYAGVMAANRLTQRDHVTVTLINPHPVFVERIRAAREVLFRLRLLHPDLTAVWADSAYAGQLVDWAKSFLALTVRTVSRPKHATGFVVLPRRWVVERSLGWIMHARRLVRDCEPLPQHSETLITWAAITLMARRLTQPARQALQAPNPGSAPHS